MNVDTMVGSLCAFGWNFAAIADNVSPFREPIVFTYISEECATMFIM